MKHPLRTVDCFLLMTTLACTQCIAVAAQGAGSIGTNLTGRPRLPLAGEWKAQYVREPGEQPGDQWEPKTVVLPRQVPLPFTQEPEQEKVYKNAAWFEREIAVPVDWQGYRIVLKIGRCLFGVAVYANGRKAGEIPGYGGEVDVTALVVPGQPARLRLYCGRLGLGMQSRDQITVSAAENTACNRARAHFAGIVGVFGLPEEFRLEMRSSEAYVEDVWYQTVVRGGTRIDPLVTIRSAAPIEDLLCHVGIYELDGRQPVLENTFPLGMLPAGESQHHLVLPAGMLKLWSIREPNLYVGQVVLKHAAGKELDRSEIVRFGIREFWAQGRRLYLNGQPFYPVPATWGYRAPNTLEQLDSVMAMGNTMVQPIYFNSFRFYDADWVPGAVACDERGVLYIPQGMVCHDLNLSDPAVLRDYIVWAEHYYRRYQNHPSIVIYGLGINSPGNSSDFSPAKIGRADNMSWSSPQNTRSYLISRQSDPTRLYYFHGGTRGGDICSANFYPNHTPAQEVEDWPLEYSEKGDRPFMTMEGLLAPLNVDYQKGGVLYLTEFLARRVGDEAYGGEADSYRMYSAYQWPRESASIWSLRLDTNFNPTLAPQRISDFVRAGRSWRFCGVAFDNGTGVGGVGPILQAADAGLRQPDMAWIGGPEKDWTLKDHNFYGGQTVEKTFMGVHDRNDNATWDANWELKERRTTAVSSNGQFVCKMEPYSRLRTPFRFCLPDVTVPTDYDLALTVRNRTDGQPIGRDGFAITVYPRPVAEQTRKAAPFFILDPEGETTAWLKSLGVPTEPWKAGASMDGRVLVVGRRALQGMEGLPFSAKDVEEGLRVAVFEQHCVDLEKIGFRHEDRCPRQIFIRQAGHPLTTGLTAEVLRDWQGHATLISDGPAGDRLAVSPRSFHTSNRGNVASDVIETPHFGPFVPVLDCEFDLSYTPLMTWRHGKGEVIFCQLDLVGRVGREPGADTVAANLVRYLKKPLEKRIEKTAVCLDETTANSVEALGFSATVASKRLAPKKHVLVIAGGQERLLAARRDQVAAFLAGGGEVLVLYANESLLADALFARRVKAEATRVRAGVLDGGRHPLLKGVGPQNLHWRATVDLLKLRSSDKAFVSLLDGLMGVWPCGKGRMVFFQVDPKWMADLTATREIDPMVKELNTTTKQPEAKPLADEKFRNDRTRTQWQVNRLHSLLLANLNIRGSVALTKRLFEVKRTVTSVPVNEWVVLGPVPPTGEKDADYMDNPVLAELLSHRDASFETRNSRNEKVRWATPTDSLNGLGLEGKNDLGKIYGVHMGDTAIAVTHVWSSRPREAVLGVGADWWLRVAVNGREVFRSTSRTGGFGLDFYQKVKAPLKAGWNEVVVYVTAGKNGHVFWFEITNPGDLVVAQRLQAPADRPAALPAVEDLVPDDVPPCFVLYTEPMTATLDPYGYRPW
ncbi:MAG: hypothetical protein PHR35_00560 [Kiritimatiellae bacterium]|nr:hypothetical protein [Kiritimatiellia bacterium]